jgi:hypothetical protein
MGTRRDTEGHLGRGGRVFEVRVTTRPVVTAAYRPGTTAADRVELDQIVASTRFEAPAR